MARPLPGLVSATAIQAAIVRTFTSRPAAFMTIITIIAMAGAGNILATITNTLRCAIRHSTVTTIMIMTKGIGI